MYFFQIIFLENKYMNELIMYQRILILEEREGILVYGYVIDFFMEFWDSYYCRFQEVEYIIIQGFIND